MVLDLDAAGAMAAIQPMLDGGGGGKATVRQKLEAFAASAGLQL
jgi:hypothetical protein